MKARLYLLIIRTDDTQITVDGPNRSLSVSLQLLIRRIIILNKATESISPTSTSIACTEELHFKMPYYKLSFTYTSGRSNLELNYIFILHKCY